MSEKEKLIRNLEKMGIDVQTLLVLPFEAYKSRKREHKLYKDDDKLPTQLIRIYYGLNPDKILFDNMKKSFISQYMKQESELESVHCKEEIKGLGEMYKYMHNNDMNQMFVEARKSNWFCKNYTSFTLKKLHSLLYTYAPYPELAGVFRTEDVYLPGTGTELSEWSMIKYKIEDIDDNIIALKQIAKTVTSMEDMLAYLDICVETMCKLIKIHPFRDGNGRTIRCFINNLLEEVNFPPIYIRANERTAYHSAMNKANNEGNYDSIKNFYRYKIVDSIVELDIKPRLEAENKEVQRISKKEEIKSSENGDDVKHYVMKRDRKK